MGLAFTVYGCYFLAVAIAGNLMKRRSIPPAPPISRIAAIIPARNEQAVVPKLVDSLLRQRYPRTLFDVYVVPNNCTDMTRKAALDAGAQVLDCDVPVHSKGEVLRWSFEKLMNGDRQYDAFCVFDADNVADGGFFQAVNNALAAGYGVAQGYRDSKNPDDNWVAGCTSIFWFMNRFSTTPFYTEDSAALNAPASCSAPNQPQIGFDTCTLTRTRSLPNLRAQRRKDWLDGGCHHETSTHPIRTSFVQRRLWVRHAAVLQRYESAASGVRKSAARTR
jgi:glycosyltransferase involved in cell wall biosynthesis